MNIPKEAIEKARLCGWRDGGWDDLDLPKQNNAEIALDKTFWQALGKCLGWDERMREWIAYGEREMPEWNMHALDFAEHIYQGQSTDNFWKELLK